MSRPNETKKIERRAGALGLLPVLGGCVFALPWIDAKLWPAAWVAVVALLSVVVAERPGPAFRRAFVFGFVAHATGFQWIAGLISSAVGFPFWLSFCILLVYCAYGGLQFAVFGWLVAKWSPRGAAAIVFAPSAWVALELLWPRLFPWRLGQTQQPLPQLVQIAEVTGVYGVSFLVLWGGVVGERVARVLGAREGAEQSESPVSRVRFRGSRHGLRPALVWACAMVLVWGFGAWRISDLEDTIEERPLLRVGIVQPAANGRRRLESCRALSREIEGRVDLLVWPESTVGSYSLDLKNLRSPTELARESRNPIRPLPDPRCFLICGGQSYRPGAPKLGPYYSSGFLIDREEQLIGRYHKRTLVPFGEYVPGEWWFPSLHKLCPQSVFLAPGTSAAPLEMPGLARAGILMCYEDLLAHRARELAAAGADILVNLTNDDWFGEALAIVQHQQLAQLRTVETRRYLVRSTTTGSTAVISPLGRVVAQAPLYDPDVLLVDVHTMDLQTFYTRWGDVFAWACVALVAGSMAHTWWRKRGRETGR